MQSPRIESVKTPLNIVLLTVLCAFIFLTAFQKQHWDTDIFWALTSGQWIIEHLEVPHADPFSYTFESKPWVDFTWGFQVAAHLLYTYAGGWYGLFVLQLLVVSLTFYFLFKNLDLLLPRMRSLVVLIMVCVFVSSYGRFFIRPHLFAYFFITLYLYLLNLHESRGDKRALYVIALLQVLWVNVHSSFILGIFIVGSYAVSEVVGELGRGRLGRGASASLRRLVVLALLLPVLSLVNPYGMELVLFPFVHQGADKADALRHIAEWMRLPLNELVFYFYPVPVEFFSFRVLLFGSIIAMALNRRQLKLRDAMLLAGGFYLAASHARWVAQFGFFAAPVVAAGVAGYMQARGEGARRRLPYACIAASFLLLGLTANGVWKERPAFGLGLKTGSYPIGTVAFLNNERLAGTIYNDYTFGGYLVHNGIKVFIDGRTPTVYSPYFFWTSRLAHEPPRWKRLVEEHAIDSVLINLSDKLCKSLMEDELWVPVFFDDVSILYLKQSDRFTDAISRWGISSVDPCSVDPKYEMPKDRSALQAMAAELMRVVGYNMRAGMDGVVALPHRLLGLVYTELGGEDLEAAVAEFQKALDRVDDPNIYYDLGRALNDLGRSAEAAGAFEALVKRKRGFRDGRLALGLVYRELGEHESAVDHLEKYVRLADDETTHEAYSALGFSCYELDRLDCAARYLERAAFTTDEPARLGNIYYYLGSIMTETGSHERAAVFYKKAIRAEPEYSVVLGALADSFNKMGMEEKAGRIREVLAGD